MFIKVRGSDDAETRSYHLKARPAGAEEEVVCKSLREVYCVAYVVVQQAVHGSFGCLWSADWRHAALDCFNKLLPYIEVVLEQILIERHENPRRMFPVLAEDFRSFVTKFASFFRCGLDRLVANLREPEGKYGL